MEVIIAEADLDRLRQSPNSPEQPATFVYQGVRKKALFRVRGGSSRSYVKKSWRIECTDEPCIAGRHKLNLLSEMADRTFIVEKLGYDLLAALGAPAPAAEYVRLYINGRYEGLYLNVERIDKAFVKSRYVFADGDASIYRCGSQDCEMKTWRAAYQAPWQKMTNEMEPDNELQSFLASINQTTDDAFVQQMNTRLDVGSYLSSMVMDALIANDIVMDSGSYWVYDAGKQKWTYVPWDLNNSAARWWPTYGLTAAPYTIRPIPVFGYQDSRVVFFYDQRKNLGTGPYYPAFSTLTSRFSAIPELRQKYLSALDAALADLFTEKQVHERLDQLHRLIQPFVQSDPHVNLYPEGTDDPDGYAKFLAGLPYLKTYVTKRIAFVRSEMSKMRSRPLTVAISKIDVQEGWAEVKNFGSAPASTADLSLGKDLRRWFEAPIAVGPMELAPGQELRIPVGALSPGGELGLFRSSSIVPLDAVFYGDAARFERSVQ